MTACRHPAPWMTLAVLLAAPPAHALPGDLDATFGSGGIVTTPVGAGDDQALGVLLLPGGGAMVAGWTHNGTDRDIALAAYDAAGLLVPTFGSGGVVTTPVGTGDDVAEAIAAGRDGRPVVAGWTVTGTTTEILLVRYDGAAPDPTFGTGGIVRTPVPGGGQAFALVANGNKLVVAGRAGDDLLVARYDANGSLDPSFGTGGIVITPVGGPAAAMSVTASGDVFIAGWVRQAADADLVLAHYHGDGDLDLGFDGDGIVVTSLGTGDDVAEAIVRDGNRTYVAGWSQGAGGTEIVLARYRSSGALHSSFGTGGVVRRAVGTDARALALAVERNGRLLAAGWTSTGGTRSVALLRHLDDGSLDASFGSGGVVTTPIGVDAAAEDVAILDDGRSLVAGHTSGGSTEDLMLARYRGTPRCGNGLLETDVGETCDDGNARTGDCCSPSCHLDPPGFACARDANPCTDDQCDGAGACLHPPAAAACDTHLCYRGHSIVPVSEAPVVLASALGDTTGSVRRPRALCLPGGVDGGAVDDATLSQEAYRARLTDRRLPVDARVTDRFGTLHLRMRAGQRLLLPTHIGLGGPPSGPPSPGAANAFRCYRVGRAPGAPGLPDGLQATIADAFTTRRYELRRPKRLCVPVDVNGSEIALPAAYLLCYRVRLAAGEPRHPGVEGVDTANLLGTGRLSTREVSELCVPTLAELCDTLPACIQLGGQSADCTYDPIFVAPTHPLCQGPKVLVDATHANFHVIVDPDGLTGRYWGFARLLSRDGYIVEQSDVPVATLLPRTDADVLVIANPTTDLTGGPEAVPAEEVPVIVDWVRDGGALFLAIDHDPYERVGLLLAALGVERLPVGTVERYTFTASSGDLNVASTVVIGPGPDTAVDEVTTFTGTAFRIASNPPVEATFEEVLIFPPGFTGDSAGEVVDLGLGGYVQGLAIRFGAGRVYVAGEAGGLTAQTTFGVQFAPDNERFVRNILWWLTE